MIISLKKVTEDDITSEVIRWYENVEIIRFSDNQYRNFTIDSQREYIRKSNRDKNLWLRGIYVDDTYVGNIVLNDIQSNHKRAELTYLIGNRNYWGKGIAAKSIELSIQYARSLSLNKVYAGVSSKNYGSQKVLIKNGFILEGIRTKHLYYNKQFTDQLDYGLVLKYDRE